MFVFSKNTPNTFNAIPQDKTKNSFGDFKSKTFRNKEKDTQKLNETGQNRLLKSLKIQTKTSDNVWCINAGFGQSSIDAISFEHPASFPEELAAKHIHSWSNEGDLVYDPFTGSGTTLKMAHLQKRNWIGSEISEEYVKLANKRIAPYLTVQSLF
jgi:site-specific DNA-methyltransferase (adenine-specific)